MGNESYDFFADAGQRSGPQAGPSWQRADWPLAGGASEDDLTSALDPLALKAAVKAAATKPGAPALSDEAAIEDAARDAVNAWNLIRTYRVRGHLAAKLDPLGLVAPRSARRSHPRVLRLHRREARPPGLSRRRARPGMGDRPRDRRDPASRTTAAQSASNTCTSSTSRSGGSSRTAWKAPTRTIEFTPEGKRAILAAVIRGEQYEKFLGRKYVGTKRFGLDGGESMIPALEAVIKYGGQLGVKEIVYGMSHRGRLNVLANVMAKPYKVIFHEFSGGTANPDDVGGSGDVKYHLGTSTDREFDGIKVHMSLMPNPSHLETVDPVVLGKVRAYQTIRDDIGEGKHKQVLPVLIHGDAAFAGQGIVWECFGFSGIRGYNTGGCIHFVINNQIGFTTSPQFARSSPYPSDVAKGVQAPILHVNGDDPAAVTFCCKFAIDYRQKFGRDIVIDMWCYRRFGHNEGDEPSFTQPLMYAKIRQHPPVSEIYAQRLIAEGVIDESFVDDITGKLRRASRGAVRGRQDATRRTRPTGSAGSGAASTSRWIPKPRGATCPTGIEPKLFDSLGRTLTTVPDDLHVHKTLERVIEAKRQAFDKGPASRRSTGRPARRWRSARCCRKATRCGCRGRIRGAAPSASATRSGSTSSTSTSTSRSRPCRTAGSKSTTARCPNTACSASNTALPAPTRRRWCCGKRSSAISPTARRSSSTSTSPRRRPSGCAPTAWCCCCRTATKARGPSIARPGSSAILQLCAQDNIQVCNIIDAVELLPRAAPADAPAVPQAADHHDPQVAAAASAARVRSRSTSSARATSAGSCRTAHRPPDETVRRLVLCSGKVGYDLMEARDSAELGDVTVVRLEQLYPFPGEPLAARIARMRNLEEVVWCQEEPKNNGAWFFVAPLIEEALALANSTIERPVYAGRAASASPATGLAKRHQSEQRALVANALGLSVRSEIRRQRA